MEIVDSESPGHTTHCSRFPDSKDSIYVLFPTVFHLILLSVKPITIWCQGACFLFPFSRERGYLLVLPCRGSRA